MPYKTIEVRKLNPVIGAEISLSWATSRSINCGDDSIHTDRPMAPWRLTPARDVRTMLDRRLRDHEIKLMR